MHVLCKHVPPHVVIKMVAVVSDSDTEWEEDIVNKPITQEKGSVSKRLILLDTISAL